jgi:RNA polymerase sigma factor (TIGR02999 family)
MHGIRPGEITALLSRSRDGDKQAEERLAELILPELRRIASKILRRERPGQTLQTADLVNEVYMKVSPELRDYNDSVHFKAYAAKKMRWILIDRARSKSNQGFKVEADESDEPLDSNKIETILALEESLNALKQNFPRAAQAVELRFYGGLTHEEAATALGVSVKTVKEDWRFAKAFLKTKLDSIGN